MPVNVYLHLVKPQVRGSKFSLHYKKNYISIYILLSSIDNEIFIRKDSKIFELVFIQ